MTTGRRFTSGLRTIGVAAASGGVGQSTISLDWARALAGRGQRTLLLEIAGGDLAWLVGVSPSQFAEDVARGAVSPAAAAIEAAANLDLLATGNDWAVTGCEDESSLARLINSLDCGFWEACVIDLGHTSPRRARVAWEACQTIAVVMDDDLSCVSRSYALIRQLLELGWGDRLALVFNHLTDPAQVESLRQRFDQITRAFLGLTIPLIGVVPDGPEPKRAAAVVKWAPASAETAQTTTMTATTSGRTNRIIDAALLADIKV